MTVLRGDAAHRARGGPEASRLVGRQAAWRLGISVREYREIEAGERSPSWETWDRICRTFGWPQTFMTVL
jgi:DNA-binding XRE family transcriptional regulator